MLASTFTCPRCRRSLQTATPLSAGQQVVCSGCGACFTAGPQAPAQAPLPNAGALPDWLQPDDPPAPPPRRPTPADPPPARYDPPALDPVPVKAAPPDRPGERAWLAREEQERVNKAIAKGVEHLKKVQTAEGTWDHEFAVGMA